MWTELPFARELVEKAETDEQASADVDAIVAFARSLDGAGGDDDPSVEAFLAALDASEGAPELAAGDDPRDEVAVLTAHATIGREFDTVVVLGALEGDFPSLSRPEPMFDLAALEGVRSRSEINRMRLADERRLFTVVRNRARRRVLLTATDPHGSSDAVTLTTRFADELGVDWRDAPSATDGAEPVNIAEAAALWRRTGADAARPRVERLAALEGLIALGEDPHHWWFQRDWSPGHGTASGEPIRVSYSRLDTLENCELQYVLSTELGLDPGGGHQAWVGRTFHQLIEDCENGLVERSPAGFRRALGERWEEARFPSYAISEAELHHAQTHLVDNWFARYAELPAAATERVFEFDHDGATIRGKIDRIGPVPGGRTRITDYKTGRSDNAGPPAQSLQLGIYYLAVNEVEELSPHRPVEAVELAFLGGKRADPALDVKEWTIEAGHEAEYQQRVRERVSALITRIQELRASGRYVASTAANCFFCRFQPLCGRYPQGAPVFPVETAGRGEEVGT
jgi:RecB family exonuclease